MSLNTGLVSYWKTDESSGNAADSVGSNTGTNTDVTYAAGKINNGAVFNGSSSRLALPTGSLVPTTSGQAMSISLWVKSDTASNAGSYRQLFSFKYGFQFRWSWGDGGANYGSFVYQTVSNAYSTPNLVISASTWHHIVCVYDGTNMKLYIDGAQSGSDIAVTAGVRYETGNNFLGSSQAPGDFYDGMLDEIGLWSKGLTAAEVTELYNSGAGLAYPFSEPATPMLHMMQITGGII